MATEDLVPFSARIRGAHAQVDNDFPNSARVGLLHLLRKVVINNYVEGWQGLAMELDRIARVSPSYYDTFGAMQVVEETIKHLSWQKVYDFCERLHNHLAQDDGYNDSGEFIVRTPRSEVQLFIASELQRLVVEEGLAFEFRDGLVQRRGRRHSVERISRAEIVLGDPRLDQARKHYQKALRFFRDQTKPDYENAVKEAVCAVEASGKELFPEAKATTLGDLVKWLTGNEPGKLPKALAQTFTGLYGFRSGGEGVGHGGAAGGAATPEIAEYALALAASQIILLVDLANANESEIPF